jgi:hypothetical protein
LTVDVISEYDLGGRINTLIGSVINETRGLNDPVISRVAMFRLITEWVNANWFAIQSDENHPRILTLLLLAELRAVLKFLSYRYDDFHELQCHIERIDETFDEVTRRVQDAGEVERCRPRQS